MNRLYLVVAMIGLGCMGCESKSPTPGPPDSSAQTTVATETSPSAEKPEAVEPTHRLTLSGEFQPGQGDPAGLPEDAPQKALAKIDVPVEATAQLNEQARTIVEQVLRRKGVEPTGSGEQLPDLVVSVGTAVEPDPKRPMTHKGLLVKVDLKRTDGTHRAASRQIPPATSGGELIANLDHTLNALVTLVLEKAE